MSPLSVRTRITVVATALVALVVVAISVLIVRLVENDVRADINQALTEALESQASLFGGMAVEDLPGDQETSFQLRSGGKTYELGLFDELSGGNAGGQLTVDGDLTAILEIDLETNDIVAMVDPATGAAIDDSSLRADLQELTFAMLQIDGPDGPALLVGATATDDIDASTAAVRRALMFTAPLLVAAAAVLTWWLAGRSLRPVGAITRQVQAISTTNLDQRVPLPGGNDEVAELARVMNQMLERLQAGDARQREFAADASHELRSPLSTVQAAAELIELDPTGERTAERAGHIRAEVERMDSLIGDLLALARSDEDIRADVESVDLVEIVRMAAKPSGAMVTAEAPVMVAGDAGQLVRLVRNLVDNAGRHADETVGVAVACGDGWARLTVEDDGDGVPEADRDQVFERFTRLDDGRSRHQGGAGLGLALVKAIVERHDGSVMVDRSPTLGGARFSVRLPLLDA